MKNVPLILVSIPVMLVLALVALIPATPSAIVCSAPDTVLFKDCNMLHNSSNNIISDEMATSTGSWLLAGIFATDSPHCIQELSV